jgi:hypothetical protein
VERLEAEVAEPAGSQAFGAAIRVSTDLLRPDGGVSALSFMPAASVGVFGLRALAPKYSRGFIAGGLLLVIGLLAGALGASVFSAAPRISAPCRRSS